jgi:hypothetical protein
LHVEEVRAAYAICIHVLCVPLRFDLHLLIDSNASININHINLDDAINARNQLRVVD